MDKKLKGIALVLFGILLCCADRVLNSTILHSLSDFPFALIGLFVGIVGLVLVFWEDKVQ